MAVNPLSPTIPYSVTASNETSDNSRQRQEKNTEDNDPKLKIKLVQERSGQDSLEPDSKQSIVFEASELASQIVDSFKVIELLSHRPKLKKSVLNCFSKSKTSFENSQITDIKKYNKAF